MIKPTIGRVVIVQRATPFTPPEGIPALVCRVWGDRCINAAGFNEGGTPVSFSSLTLLQDDDLTPALGAYAEWMPYQKGQAAKTEALEAAVQLQPPADDAHVAVGSSLFSDPTKLQLPPHQQRVITEKAELDDRLSKLKAFFDTPIYAGLDEEEQLRLKVQDEAMCDYSNVLNDRIKAFAA